MRRQAALSVLCCALVFTTPVAFAFDVTSVNLHLHLAGLKRAEKPSIVDRHLVLSVAGAYRFVGAAFSHEGWRTIHAFEINSNGVFVLALPLPYGDAATVQYRLVLDGVWVADPANPDRVRDPGTGAALSLARFPAQPKTVLGVWDPAVPNGATFYFEGEPGQRVTVAGSFNGWDPFIHELEEVAPGRYELRLTLSPGEYYYIFMYRGERLADPLNRRVLFGKDGRPVSALTVTES